MTWTCLQCGRPTKYPKVLSIQELLTMGPPHWTTRAIVRTLAARDHDRVRIATCKRCDRPDVTTWRSSEAEP